MGIKGTFYFSVASPLPRQKVECPLYTSTPLTYDDNGNLLEDDQSNEYTYDAWNRMITVNESARYAYDSLGRRVKEGDRTLVYSANWQVLEEQVADESLYQYVWSPVYVDAMVARIEYGSSEMMMMMSQESDWNPETREWEMPLELSSMLTSEPVQILYVLQDANFNVTALVTDGGDIAERFVYDPYGKFEVYQGDWQEPLANSNYAWIYLHQGGRYDGDAELFSFRNRDYSPRLMRWVEQDPIQFQAGDSSLYRALSGSPLSRLDPIGFKDGRNPWAAYGCTYDDPLPPLKPTEIRLCVRPIDTEGMTWYEQIGAIVIDIWGHTYIDYGLDANGNVIGIGVYDTNKKSGDLPQSEKHLPLLKATSCQSCVKTESPLGHGSAKGKKAIDATDDEIYDCMKNYPMSKDFSMTGYNCGDWATEAARACGLDCGMLANAYYQQQKPKPNRPKDRPWGGGGQYAPV